MFDDQSDDHKNNNIIEDEAEDSSIIDRVETALEMTDGIEIVRRYVVMNAFDGALTMLGLILVGGLSVLNIQSSDAVFDAIILAGVGSSIAMAVSGFSGSYLTESAERQRGVHDLHRTEHDDVPPTAMYRRASRITALVVALADGLSPAVAAFIIMIPLLMVPLGIMNHLVAIVLSVIVCMTELFVLGVFLGTVSKGSKLSYGLKTLIAGILTAIIMFIIALMTDIGP